MRARYLAPDDEWRVPESVLNPSVVRGFDELRGLLKAEFEAFSEVRRESRSSSSRMTKAASSGR